MTIKKKIKDITQMITKTIQMTNNEFKKPDIKQAYDKCVEVIMKCRTEVQLDNARRYLRNYERLMQNSYLYPTLSKSFKKRTAHNLLSLIRLKRKEFYDL